MAQMIHFPTDPADPVELLELDGPQAVERGRMITTTSTNQFGATVARWLGVPDTDLATVFPGLGNFDRPVLDFLG